MIRLIANEFRGKMMKAPNAETAFVSDFQTCQAYYITLQQIHNSYRWMQYYQSPTQLINCQQSDTQEYVKYLIHLYYLTAWAQLLLEIKDCQLPSYSQLYNYIGLCPQTPQNWQGCYTLASCNPVQFFGWTTTNQLVRFCKQI